MSWEWEISLWHTLVAYCVLRQTHSATTTWKTLLFCKILASTVNQNAIYLRLIEPQICIKETSFSLRQRTNCTMRSYFTSDIVSFFVIFRYCLVSFSILLLPLLTTSKNPFYNAIQLIYTFAHTHLIFLFVAYFFRFQFLTGVGVRYLFFFSFFCSLCDKCDFQWIVLYCSVCLQIHPTEKVATKQFTQNLKFFRWKKDIFSSLLQIVVSRMLLTELTVSRLALIGQNQKERVKCNERCDNWTADRQIRKYVFLLFLFVGFCFDAFRYQRLFSRKPMKSWK